MRLLVALLCALTIPVAVALGAGAPTATTDPAKDVAQSSATLTATVNPNGAPTTVHFDYGTSASYGLKSGEKSVDGTSAVSVEIPVTGLTANTTYHYRVSATNSAGTANGSDRTFKTAAPPPNPTPPGVATGGVRDVTASSATLTGLVNPRGAATTYHFEYGTTSKLGSRTPDGSLGAGNSSIRVTAPISGLAANDRISYRLVATNAAGTRRAAIHTFTTARGLTSASIALSATRVTYGDGVTITGKLAGKAVSGVSMILEAQASPFSAPFRQVGLPVNTARNGSYKFTVDPLLLTTRLRVATRFPPRVVSPVAVARSAPRVGFIAQRVRGRRVRVRGTVHPLAPHGTASLQRRLAGGRWVTVRRVALTADAARSRYAMVVRRRRGGGTYRVMVSPRDGGAHARGFSRVRALR
jgi:hypothetical protein